MNPDDLPSSALTMPPWQAWLEAPAGRYLRAWEQAQLDRVVADVFGYHAVQIGMPQLDALRCNRMPFTAFCGDWRNPLDRVFPLHDAEHTGTFPAGAQPWRAFGQQIMARFEELPFATHSLDLVVLPHALEFAEDPHLVLREVERVLIADGKLVVTGFNPWSLWGLRQSAGKRLGSSWLPGEGQFLTLSRLRDWLKLLAFDLLESSHGVYVWPADRAHWLERLDWMEKAGHRWWPVCGAVYVVVAVKRVRGMRMIGAPWRDAVARPGQVAAPIGRMQDEGS